MFRQRLARDGPGRRRGLPVRRPGRRPSLGARVKLVGLRTAALFEQPRKRHGPTSGQHTRTNAWPRALGGRHRRGPHSSRQGRQPPLTSPRRRLCTVRLRRRRSRGSARGPDAASRSRPTRPSGGSAPNASRPECDGGRTCQKKHWRLGGHRQLCAEPPCCIICLEGGDDPLPMQRQHGGSRPGRPRARGVQGRRRCIAASKVGTAHTQAGTGSGRCARRVASATRAPCSLAWHATSCGESPGGCQKTKTACKHGACWACHNGGRGGGGAARRGG